ncbi:ATP-binding protein [Lichenibacterium dinghuense]|uniref:ATP-binding protein n=1 Tax=Lichenibacterium dinghuense TaxID=2895977 RepID=UPI001F32FB7A|nr:ATP-binding protein [Lichenibacterium sp. 6Y81]
MPESSSDMTAAVRDFPWGDTPLGDRLRWPAHRRGFVDALLLSPAPMAAFWGADAVAVFNDAFAALRPGSPAERLGRPARDGWPELAVLVAAARAGEAPAGRADDFRAAAIRGPDGSLDGVLVTAAAAGDARRDAGAEASLAAASWSATLDGGVESLGPRWFGLTGLPEAESFGDGWCRVVHPEDLERTVATWAGAVASGRPYDIEHRLRTGDGTYRWMRTRAERACERDGTPIRWQGRTELLDWRRAVENRQALLLRIADTFRSAVDRHAVVSGAVSALGRETGAARALYAEVDPAHHDATVEAEWSRAGGPSAAGPRRGADLDALALGRRADVEAGLTVIASDAAGGAGLAVPLVRDGRLRALFHLAAEAPRRWLPEEVALVEDVAARSWDALERIAASTLLRRNQARQSFLLVLGDRLRDAVDGAEIAEITAEALGRQLHVARAGYGEVAGSGDALAFGTGWAADGIPSLAGVLPFGALGPGVAQDLGRGLTAVIEDGAPALTLGLATVVAVPLIRDGRLRGVLTAGRTEAHRWSAEEIALVGEVASRMWEALERTRAEAALIDLNATLETRVVQRTAELASSEARFRILFENAPVSIVLIRVGGDGRAVFEAANAAAESFLGRDLVGRDVAAVTGPDDPLHERALACAASGDPVQYEMTTTVGGESRTAEGVLAPLAIGDGEGRMLIGISRDITAQRSVEEQLRQAQKMEAIGQLTGGIAHDFNNLLTGIIGSLALMQKRLGQGRTESLERYAGLALASANRAAALTHRLLAFSRRQPLEAKAVDANALVHAMGELLRRTLGESVVLRSVETPGLWATLCDPHQLENALLNLAINARDAMPDGGRLTIETANAVLDESYVAREPGVLPGAYVMVSVSDTGTGMPPEVVARAFDPFFTTKPIGQGTGLGLSMIYGFVKQSDGHIKIYSEPGQGTSIKLFLPRFRGAGEPAQAGPTEGAPRAEAGETVLLVEDDPTVRDLVLDLLGELGYAVHQAPDGPSGLRVVGGPGRIDLLITDVGLPGMNGRQFAAEARALRPDLKVLFITGYAENAAFGNGHLDPDMQMMTKPFAVDALAQRIRAMMG